MIQRAFGPSRKRIASVSAARRPFFASSTDHTTLLQQAQIHRFQSDSETRQYVLAAHGMDLDTVRQVPQLHLARIFLQNNGGGFAKVYGAKVVNRTLGAPVDVCGRLLDAVLDDCNASSSSSIQAWSTLHGLSDWVLKEASRQEQYSESDRNRLEAIANNKVNLAGQDSTADMLLWEPLAQQFVETQPTESEASLYQSHSSFTWSHVEAGADSSEFADTSASCLGVFRSNP